MTVGLKGKLTDNVDLHLHADTDKNTRVSAIYHPHKNLDMVVTNNFKFDDPFNKDMFNPSFTLKVHD